MQDVGLSVLGKLGPSRLEGNGGWYSEQTDGLLGFFFLFAPQVAATYKVL